LASDRGSTVNFNVRLFVTNIISEGINKKPRKTPLMSNGKLSKNVCVEKIRSVVQ
jgi:hypothetical protein